MSAVSLRTPHTSSLFLARSGLVVTRLRSDLEVKIFLSILIVKNQAVMGAKASKERLSKEDLEFLARNTHYEEDTISEWYRGFKQDCPDGKLNPEAFMRIYTKCFPIGKAAQFCEHVFRTFDTDRNGFIDFKEFLLAIDVTASGTPEEKLSWAFKYAF